MGVWFKTGKIASRLRSQVQPGDIGFGHSHGCLIIHEAARLGAPFKKVVYIAPALRADVQFPPQIQQARVYHSKNDSPVKAAKLSRILMPWCFFGHPEWGDMGNVGPQGPDVSSESLDLAEEIRPTRDQKVSRPARFLQTIDDVLGKYAWLIWPMRLMVGAPLGLFYWLVCGPFEVLLTYYFNNVRNSEPQAAMELRDWKFIVAAFVLPVVTWISLVRLLM